MRAGQKTENAAIIIHKPEQRGTARFLPAFKTESLDWEKDST